MGLVATQRKKNLPCFQMDMNNYPILCFEIHCFDVMYEGKVKHFWAEKFIWWCHSCCSISSKFYSIKAIFRMIAKGTMLKNTLHLVIIHENVFVGQWSFQQIFERLSFSSTYLYHIIGIMLTLLSLDPDVHFLKVFLEGAFTICLATLSSWSSFWYNYF